MQQHFRTFICTHQCFNFCTDCTAQRTCFSIF